MQRNHTNSVSPAQEGSMDGGMIGKTYFEGCKPVTVLVRWGKGGGPRSVLIRRHDGSEVVRPFRGLTKLPSKTKGATTEELYRRMMRRFGRLRLARD